MIRITGGTVTIKGDALEICEMNADELLIKGRISGIDRRKKGE